ncbi:cyclic nucleotide-binding domain-containing protein [Thermodesulfobacteriota bacterium]
MASLQEVKEFKVFTDIIPEEIEVILNVSQEVSFQTGDVIIEEAVQSPDSDLFIILEGRVEVDVEFQKVQLDLSGHKRLRVLSRGETFGEMGLLHGKRRSARIKAYSDLRALKVSRTELFELFTRNPRLGYIFMRNLVSILSDRLIDINFMWRDEI